MEKASPVRRRAVFSPGTARGFGVFITVVTFSALSYLLTILSMDGKYLLSNVTRESAIPPPKVMTESERSPPRVPISSGSHHQGQNVLFKLWDKSAFSHVDPNAYTAKEVFSKAGRPLSMGLTSFNMTQVRLISSSPTGRDIYVGDVLQYRIQSRDLSGRNRISGGDMWYATLSCDKHPKASTAGHIVDYGNGTYDAFLLAAWPGRAKFTLTLVHASETVHYMRDTLWNSDRRVSWIGQYVYKGKRQDTSCFLQNHGSWTEKCEYPAYNALGSTVFLCDRKPDFPCDSLYSTRMDNWAIEPRAQELIQGVEYLFEGAYNFKNVPVESASIQINGKDRRQYKLPRCKADQQIPAIQGFWKDGRWKSLLCAFSNWTESGLLTSCLRGKQVVLMGDSTVRQWLGSLTKLLNMTFREVKHPSGAILWAKRNFTSFNISIYFQFHPFMVVANRDRLTDMMNEVDVLGKLTNADCNYVAVVSPWAHFAQWTRDSYIERVRLIRKAVIDFRRRCPDAPVVIKGAHPRDHRNMLDIVKYSDYYLQQIEFINREAFAGIRVFYLPIWDMTVADPSPNKVHNPENVIMEELRIFLGYVCDTLLPQGVKT